jgi:Component of IIS longevity pathway SMK-1
VTYLRDTLLRPTMDESSLSTLSSLQTFTHTDVVKGVTSPIKNASVKGDSYLVRVMRMLGKEVRAISELEWEQLNNQGPPPVRPESPQPVVVSAENSTWNQHLAPQDDSLPSRKIRRRGCLSFFRELFNMVRTSLQQSDKDDFYAAIVCMEVYLNPQVEMKTTASDEKPSDKSDSLGSESETINLLSVLAAILADPTVDATERGSILEIIGAIATHDPSHIRRHSLEFHEMAKRHMGSNVNILATPGKPTPNERHQILFRCPPDDVIASLLFLLAVETDAGLLLQTTEIMRIILDTDMLGDHGPMGAGLNVEDDETPPGFSLSQNNGMSNGSTGQSIANQDSDQHQFLSLFYDHFIQWLVAPFQYTILYPARRLPDSLMSASNGSPTLDQIVHIFKRGATKEDSLVLIVQEDATRVSFAIELLSFCVRAHLYRMKFFLLRSRVLASILKLLNPNWSNSSGDRCLKLAGLRLLRSILAVKDEFYHRHIIQHNLFAPVFEAFRANPVGDNLVSSAIVEMCDFIQNQNIKSLIEYIVTKHLVSPSAPGQKSLEDVATPYVNTLTTLRKDYEGNLHSTNGSANNTTGNVEMSSGVDLRNGGNDYHRFFSSSLIRNTQSGLSEKAMEDQVSDFMLNTERFDRVHVADHNACPQRKFRQADADESYFDSDDDDDAESGSAARQSSTQVAAFYR